MPEADPEILDLAFLHRQTEGDADLERELLGLLVGQCAELLPVLGSNPDGAARRDAAHGLRGAAAGLGANRLAAVAAAIEAGREPPIGIEQAIGEVRCTIERLLDRDAA